VGASLLIFCQMIFLHFPRVFVACYSFALYSITFYVILPTSFPFRRHVFGKYKKKLPKILIFPIAKKHKSYGKTFCRNFLNGSFFVTEGLTIFLEQVKSFIPVRGQGG